MHQNNQMAGMEMSRDFLYTFAMWAVMMAGMMAPSAAPVFLLYAKTRAARGEGMTSPAVLLFGSGYLTVWTAFSVCAALAQGALHQAALLSPAMKVASPRIAGAILIAAGVYQLTPWKQKCLTHCRSPLGFLMTQWRQGLRGAFQMGLSHGLFCVGCCWALMGILFAVGVMNLVWVAVLTAVVLLEKVGPAGAIAARVAGVALVVFGVLRFFY
jgi:predicted metal-binding membrane protein